MAFGKQLYGYEKGEFTILKRVGKSQREISKALGHCKTVICNYLKSQNYSRTRKPSDTPENFVIIKNIEISSGCSLQF